MKNMRYETILVMAIKAHDGQTRWNGEPYICHPVRVAARVAARMIGKFTPEVIELHKIAAVCHDLLEDTNITAEDIRQIAGDEVVAAVEHLTCKDHKESYVDFIDRCSKNAIALRVKLADLEDNTSDLRPGHKNWKKYGPAIEKLTALLPV